MRGPFCVCGRVSLARGRDFARPVHDVFYSAPIWAVSRRGDKGGRQWLRPHGASFAYSPVDPVGLSNAHSQRGLRGFCCESFLCLLSQTQVISLRVAQLPLADGFRAKALPTLEN